jgi:hypothetical protein
VGLRPTNIRATHGAQLANKDSHNWDKTDAERNHFVLFYLNELHMPQIASVQSLRIKCE